MKIFIVGGNLLLRLMLQRILEKGRDDIRVWARDIHSIDDVIDAFKPDLIIVLWDNSR